MDGTALATGFWEAMATNDFARVRPLLATDFVLDWPQSGERIVGPDNFIRMNEEYPANGPWRFTVERLVGAADEAVTSVRVTDGVVHGRAITFFTVADGRISRIVEYWPEPFAARPERAHLVELNSDP